MSIIGQVIKDLTSKVDAADAQDQAAQLSINQQTLSEMEQLNKRIGATSGGLSMEEYNERLRKEGGGL